MYKPWGGTGPNFGISARREGKNGIPKDKKMWKEGSKKSYEKEQIPTKI